jgi:hypothetical protein
MKLVFNKKKGFVEKLFIKNKNIIFPWGIECGDSSSFFSLTEKGWRVDKKFLKKIIKENSTKGNVQIRMSEGLLNLNYEDKFESKIITRKATLRALKDSYLMDFVVRYRFKKKFFKYAKINNRKIYHNNSNKYYQYPVKKAFLVANGFKVKISFENYQTLENFKPVMYVRDYKDEWIVHCRLFPKKGGKEIVKLNTTWYNRALPQRLSKFLLKSSFLKKIIWYRMERSPYPRWNFLFKYLLKPCGYEVSLLEKDKNIKLSTKMSIVLN